MEKLKKLRQNPEIIQSLSRPYFKRGLYVIKPFDEPVGIDDLSLHIPKLFLSATEEFAESRGIEPAKLAKGIGIENMSIPDAHEDAATMGAMSLKSLMERNDLKPKQIAKIYVGTESGVDEAKAIGMHIIGMMEKIYGVGSFEECETVELKSACIGATIALDNLCNWLALSDEDRIGIVIASDIARYRLNSPGEYTQGAGAISLLLRKKPRLVTLDGITGLYTQDVNDFFRPLGSSTAVVNGKMSNLCYLNAINRAFRNYKKKVLQSGMIVLEDGQSLTDHFSHLLFHIPYPKMAEYASASIFRSEWRELPRWEEVEREIGKEPCSDNSDDKSCLEEDSAYSKKFSKTKLFLQACSSKVRDSTLISRHVGNIYTGSLYLGLISLMEAQRLVHGQRVAFGSYGSGCSAMIFSGIVQEGLKSLPAGRILEQLEGRTKISLNEYENLHEGKKEESILPPMGEFALIGMDSYGYRRYEFIS